MGSGTCLYRGHLHLDQGQVRLGTGLESWYLAYYGILSCRITDVVLYLVPARARTEPTFIH
jgi:hypothetical protein